ncbi:hypothetical protein A1O3_08211 [Capronia epimyces CBS 606.96]|uniref:Xylanolytic transcriptional activator regulatory domain-containing protein n=1 Tax=Capronia epimyces CBS 606.96 TaxID=1182542 RepID=W9XSI9_9EURO|nr:uncharacterized protein A1O3_08211 [Capronia epimyces CBS 606.96]EXJ79926.1 hypothetical protein A1O3_08211 [Capronia epimyces CBS 606.96]
MGTVPAYFDEALDSALGIVHRPWFEAQLRSYLDGSINDSDPAWYALRNAIYASGSRVELSKTKTFLEANQTAWGWFENALAAHTEILYFRTSILGVQALTVMAYYSHNIGSPCLEYMLCTNALRLAVAKGLHRQPVSSWNSSEHENNLRSCLFWAAYCLEKQIVSQSGRHSLIDDDDVNCQVPTQVPAGSTVNLQYFTILIRLARLSSVVSKRLSTVRAFQQGAELLVRSVAELDEQLNALRRSVDPILFLESPINLKRMPAGMTLQQAMYLRYGFFNVALDIHTALTYPWCRSMVGLTPHAALRNQVEKSTQTVAETCRSAILATEHIHFDANTPVPMSFFGPMYALINLFIYILQTPQQSRIQSDLALMDVAAGHFARMQIATDSEVTFTFAKEVAALAHEAVARGSSSRRYSGNESLGMDSDPSRLRPDMSDCMTDRTGNVLEDDLQCDDPTASYVNPFFDLELENWSTFLPAGFDDKVMDFSVG